MHLQLSQIKVGHYYSNGQYGHHWSIRQITQEEISHNEVAQDKVTYKVVAGKGRRQSATCTREELAHWAKYEVYRDENSWKILT